MRQGFFLCLYLNYASLYVGKSIPNVPVARLRIAQAEIIITRPIIPKVMCFTPCSRAVGLLAPLMYSAHPNINTKKATAIKRPISGKSITLFKVSTNPRAASVPGSFTANVTCTETKKTNKELKNKTNIRCTNRIESAARNTLFMYKIVTRCKSRNTVNKQKSA